MRGHGIDPLRIRLLPVALTCVLGLAACGRPDTAQERDAPTEEAEASAEGPSAGTADNGAIPSRLRLSPEELDHVEIRTIRVARRPLRPRVLASGEVRVDDSRVAEIVSRVPGIVEDVHAFQEDAVAAGSPLVEIYSTEYLIAQQELLQARARVSREEAGGDSTSVRLAREILEASRERLALLGAGPAEVETLLETGRLDRTLSLRAPLSGRVLESMVVSGGSIEAGTTLLRIADLSRVWVVVELRETDLGAVALGDPIEVRAKAYPGSVFGGRLDRIGGILDPETRTVEARAVVPNPDGRLKPGMFVTVEIQTRGDGRSALAVPVESVQRLADRPVAFVPAGGGSFEIRRLDLGPQVGDFYEVRGGLAEGETVVTEGSFLLKSELTKESFGADED
jgi:multidrug efflux pump subunit AcrA (membrane-fusion protein)